MYRMKNNNNLTGKIYLIFLLIFFPCLVLSWRPWEAWSATKKAKRKRILKSAGDWRKTIVRFRSRVRVNLRCGFNPGHDRCWRNVQMQRMSGFEETFKCYIWVGLIVGVTHIMATSAHASGLQAKIAIKGQGFKFHRFPLGNVFLQGNTSRYQSKQEARLWKKTVAKKYASAPTLNCGLKRNRKKKWKKNTLLW